MDKRSRTWRGIPAWMDFARKDADAHDQTAFRRARSMGGVRHLIQETLYRSGQPAKTDACRRAAGGAAQGGRRGRPGLHRDLRGDARSDSRRSFRSSVARPVAEVGENDIDG